jgi:arylsulfatase A-like enzyme
MKNTYKHPFTLVGITLKGLGIGGAAGLLFSAGGCVSPDASPTKMPNIIYILADDLGFGELGSYGQELIETPNLDRLAEEGMRFTNHYSGSSISAPARCVLLTGMHSGQAQIRGNYEWQERGEVWNYLAVLADSTLEGQYPMAPGTRTLANYLQDAGYRTGMIGKWGLGPPDSHSTPTQMGFDFFLGYNCQRQAHTYYPVHLYKNDQRILLGNDTIPPATKLPEGADPYDPESYQSVNSKVYTPDVMFDGMMEFIRNHRAQSVQPFFMYWATPIPHVPLQAPQRWIDYYVEKFGDEEPFPGDGLYFPARYPRATYAAMISYLDENIGLLMQALKDLGLYNNTLVIFTSDNGPTFNGGSDSPWFDSGGPFRSEFGWGKGFLHEGGIRVPMIASWPGYIEPGSVSDHISAFWDVLPTFCEIAGIETPEYTTGISFLPTLLGGEQVEHEYLYWEQPPRQQAVRKGPWKGMRKDIHSGDLTVSLFNLDVDPAEQHDVAAQHPDIVKEMKRIMVEARITPNIQVFRMKHLGDPVE